MKDTLERLRTLNPGLDIRPVEDPSFAEYGRLLTEYDFRSLIDLVKDFPVPATTNTYRAELEETRDLPIYDELARSLYGEMPIQIGFGGGFCLSLNALEWHRGNEVDVAVTDFVVMLARLQDIAEGKLDSSKVRTFYLRQGQAIDLYATTLHYSPCNVDGGVFRMLVILPKGTNYPLEGGRQRGGLLAERNKWLIAHPEASSEIEAGARVAITGPNLRLKV
jgi:hypothetical protein